MAKTQHRIKLRFVGEGQTFLKSPQAGPRKPFYLVADNDGVLYETATYGEAWAWSMGYGSDNVQILKVVAMTRPKGPFVWPSDGVVNGQKSKPLRRRSGR